MFMCLIIGHIEKNMKGEGLVIRKVGIAEIDMTENATTRENMAKVTIKIEAISS
ncbi:MAG TPA: hypothetical protein VLZ07_11145 [Syntrophales bacterium]|nr:hypothetical protein [Syntrophales bacterium]